MPEKTQQRLAYLAAEVQHCRRCPLYLGRTRAVFGEGPCRARAMLIGEAPGEAEDLSGRPFTGRTGRYFDQALEACTLRRDRLFITSAVKCRPPGNRNPSRLELATCRGAWLDEQLALVDPHLVLVLGKMAFLQIFNENSALKDVSGNFVEHDGRQWLITCHPTAAMRFPRQRAVFERSLRLFAEALAGIEQRL